jgi:predicted dehydrogenase
MNKKKIGIIGCGKQAYKHLSGLRKIPGVEIILADCNRSAAEELAEKEQVSWVPDSDALMADGSVEAVCISTPTPAHVPLIKQAVDAGKDFFCEKPLCESLDEAKEVADLVQRTGRIGMIGYVYRFVPVFELGFKLFEDLTQLGESMVLGRVVSGQFRLGGRGSHQQWKHRKGEGGGVVNEMLVHMVDLAIWYFGAVENAEFLARDLLRPTRVIQGREVIADAEDYVVVRLKMASGVEVLCQADLVTPAFTQVAEVQGENGTFMGSIVSSMPSFVYCSEARAGYPAGQTPLQFGRHSVFEAQMAEFVRAVRLQKQPSRCTVQDSVVLMQALEQLKNGGSRHETNSN